MHNVWPGKTNADNHVPEMTGCFAETCAHGRFAPWRKLTRALNDVVDGTKIRVCTQVGVSLTFFFAVDDVRSDRSSRLPSNIIWYHKKYLYKIEVWYVYKKYLYKYKYERTNQAIKQVCLAQASAPTARMKFILFYWESQTGKKWSLNDSLSTSTLLES